MTKAVSICIEDISPGREPRFMRCAAIEDRDAGLGLRADGTIAWQSGDQVIDLCASGAEPAALRRADGPEINVRRAGRDLPVPTDAPMVLLNGDVILFGEYAFRIHIHGPTDAAAPPEEVHPDTPSAPVRPIEPPRTTPVPPKAPAPVQPPEPDMPEVGTMTPTPGKLPPEMSRRPSHLPRPPLPPGIAPHPPTVPQREATPTPPGPDGQDGIEPRVIDTDFVTPMPRDDRMDLGTVTPAPPRFPDPRSATCLVILIIILILAAAAWVVKNYFW